MTARACIGEPISWLRLEQHALVRDPDVAAHVASCAACRACLDELAGDRVALPPLAAPAPARRRWWTWGLPALAGALAAAIALVVLRPRPEPRPPREDVATIKGVGEVIVDVVRERGGTLVDSARTFAAGDRWKVVVTCPPSAGAWLDVGVTEVGGAPGADFPLAPAHVACGNRVVVPGAFELTGTHPNRVCVRIAASGPPARDAGAPSACVTIAPE